MRIKAKRAIWKSKTPSVYQLEKPAIAKRKSPITAQNQMLKYWDEKYHEMLKDLKRDIEIILGG